MDTSDHTPSLSLPSTTAPSALPLTAKASSILPQKRSASLTEEAETKRQKVFELAKDLWDTYLKEAHNKPREVFVQLRNAAQELKEQVERCARNQEDFSTAEAVSFLKSIMNEI
jgi:cell division septum initiation protein DivIVA